METTTTIISFILFAILVLNPFFILQKLDKLIYKHRFLLYLPIGLLTAAILTFTFAWWLNTSNEMLLAHYGYNIDVMNETEFYGKVAPENMARVKTLETSIMGIGWPLKALIIYIVYIPYLLLVYFAGNAFQRRRKINYA